VQLDTAVAWAGVAGMPFREDTAAQMGSAPRMPCKTCFRNDDCSSSAGSDTIAHHDAVQYKHHDHRHLKHHYITIGCITFYIINIEAA